MKAKKPAKKAAKKPVKKVVKKPAAKAIKKAAPRKVAKKKSLKPAAKKAVVNKAAAKKAPAGKSVVKKAVKKTVAKKPVAKKVAAKKAVTKKVVAKKIAPKKAAAKKVVTKAAIAKLILTIAATRYVGPSWPLMDLVLNALDDAKAENTVAINLEGRSSMADGMVVTTGRVNRHVAAIADQLMFKLKQHGTKNVRVEGLEAGDWCLVDTGDIIIHIFRPEVRSFYNLEKLWSADAPAEQR